MTTGHGGCGPYGLALAAARRGYSPHIFLNNAGVHFENSVRSSTKKEVMRISQDEMLKELNQMSVSIEFKNYSVQDLQIIREQGCVPIVLISSWRLYREKSPHWVVVSDIKDSLVCIFDPYREDNTCSNDSNEEKCFTAKDFYHVSTYGKTGFRTCVAICAGEHSTHKN